MQLTSILIKTAKGLEEIDTRATKLAGRLRAILFMVDGERTFGDLLNHAGNMGEQLEVQLRELADQGFIGALEMTQEEHLPEVTIEAAVAAEPVPSAAPIIASPAPSPKRLAPIDDLKTRLMDLVAESLGMRAMFVNAQIEGIALHQELPQVIDDIARTIVLSSGPKVAEKWRQKARALVEISS